MCSIPKGGRGMKAPYETVVMRIPKPIEAEVSQLVQNFRDGDHKPVTGNLDKDKLMELAICIIHERKSARKSLTKLLQVLLDDKNINL